MPAESSEARAETIQVLPPWGTPWADAPDDLRASAALWLGGGAMLLLWTAIALVLTAA